MPKKPGERVLDGPHPFWMATCGRNTHATGSTNARNETPWTSFTADGKALVCTLWADLVAPIYDPQTGSEHRFVVLGGRSHLWQSGAIGRGKTAREELERSALIDHPDSTFVARAEGGAMRDAGIDPGDVLLIDRARHAAQVI